MHRRGELHPTRPAPYPNEVDIELDDVFWDHAKAMPALFQPEKRQDTKTSVHLRMDRDVLDWFKRQGRGHLTRMNSVLRAYYLANRKKAS